MHTRKYKLNEVLIKSALAQVLFGNKLSESSEEQKIVDYFYDELLLEKILVGEPASVPELRKLLRNKILNFEFIKLDGDVRPARGTTMMKYIPKKDHPKGIRPSSPKVATFFDLEKKAWRSVSQRSKEIVLKHAFGEKKPVFVVRDKDGGSQAEKPEPVVDEPTGGFDKDFDKDIDKDFDTKVDDVKPVSKPDVKPVEKKPDIFDKDFDVKDLEGEPEETPPEVRPVVKPQIRGIEKPKYGWTKHREEPKYGWKPTGEEPPEEFKPIVRPTLKTPYNPPLPDAPEEILLPREVKRMPNVPPTKEPPLEIEPEDEDL